MASGIKEQARRIWFRAFRSRAYKVLFGGGNEVQRDAAEIVLADLARFCRHSTPPVPRPTASGEIDPVQMGILIGRLEVFHRIKAMTRATDREIEQAVAREASIMERSYLKE